MANETPTPQDPGEIASELVSDWHTYDLIGVIIARSEKVALAKRIAARIQAERDRQAAEVQAIIELIRFKADQYAKGGDMTFSHLLALADQITDGWHLRIDELRQRLRDAYGDDEEAANVSP